MQKLSLKPFFVYVPGSGDARPHFRGGDDFIVPVDAVSNPALLDAVAGTFQQNPAPITADEVAAALSDRFPSTDVRTVVELLLEGGVLWCAPPADEHGFLWRYLSRFVSDVAPLKEKLRQTDLYVWGAGEGHEEMVDALTRHGISARTGEASPEDRVPAFIVALGGFDTEARFDAVNDYCLQNKVPWIAAVRCGPEQAQIGPLFVPEETACYRCFQLRCAANRRNVDAYLAFRSMGDVPARGGIWPEAYARFVGATVALECVRFISDVAPAETVGTVYYWALDSWTPTAESVLKLPGCPCCGVPAEL